MARTSTSSLIAWTAALFFGAACSSNTFTTLEDDSTGGSKGTGGGAGTGGEDGGDTGGTGTGGTGTGGTGTGGAATGGASNCSAKIEAKCDSDNDCLAAVNVCAACYESECAAPQAASKHDVLVGGCLRAWANRDESAPEGCRESDDIECSNACAQAPACVRATCVKNECELTVGSSKDECEAMGTGGTGTGGGETGGTGGGETGGSGGLTGGTGGQGTGGDNTGGSGGSTGGAGGSGGQGTGGDNSGGSGGSTGGSGGDNTGGSGGSGGTGGGNTGGTGGATACPKFVPEECPIVIDPPVETEAIIPVADCKTLELKFQEAFDAALACSDNSQCNGGAMVQSLCGCPVLASTSDCNKVNEALQARKNMECARCELPTCIVCEEQSAGSCSGNGICESSSSSSE